MKKTLKIILPAIILIVFASILLITVFASRKEKMIILTYPYEYLISNEDDRLLDIPILVDDKDSPYFDPDLIRSCELSCPESMQIINTPIENITIGSNTYYKNMEFFQYKLVIAVPIYCDIITKLENVYLNLYYDNEEKLELLIGNIIFYPYEDDGLGYSSLKGYTYNYNDVNMLYAVKIKLINDQPYTIKGINLLTCKATVGCSYVYQNDNKIDVPKQIIGAGTNNFNIEMVEEDEIVINLSYKQYEELTILGFIIEYEIEEKTYFQTIHPFCYYTTANTYKGVKEYIYEYNKS